MKYVFALLILAATMSCKNVMRKSNLITGMYTCFYTTEFGRMYDTLEIRPIQGVYYTVNHRSRYDRKIDGKKLPPKKMTKTETGIYRDHEAVLQMEGSGRLLFYDAATERMTDGNIIYQKQER